MRMSRAKLTVALAALVVLSVAARFALPQLRALRLERRWKLVQVGMSKEEVEELLGTPATVYPAQMVQSNSVIGKLVGNLVFDSYLEKWAYRRRRSLKLPGEFLYMDVDLDGVLTPKDGDHVVYFSPKGEVVKKAHPYRN